MVKSGLIFGALAFVVAIGTALLMPLCVPCAVGLLGIGTGYVAAVFDKPAGKREVTSSGALAGLIAGFGALLGQLTGAYINSRLIGPEGFAMMREALGGSTGSALADASFQFGFIGSTVCFSAADLALMAGFGALGAVLWGRSRKEEI